MTISSTARKAGPYVGNSVATSFAFAFKVFAATDLQVVKLTAATGVQSTLVLNTDYSVALNADQNASPGGTVTYPLSGSLLASPDTITIAGNIDALQGMSLLTAGGFYPSVIENAFDRCVILIQQILGLKKSLQGPISDSSAINMELPPAITRASKALGFDSLGQPIAIAAGSAVTDSSAVTFARSETGFVARTALSKLKDFVTLSDFDTAAHAIAAANGLLPIVDTTLGKLFYQSPSFPITKAQSPSQFAAFMTPSNGVASNAFQSISVNGTLIASTYANFLATAVPDVVSMSGWGLRGGTGSNPLVVANFGTWIENTLGAVTWAVEIDSNNEAATLAEGSDSAGVALAINTGSTFSPDTGIAIRRFNGAGSAPGFLRGMLIAGVRNTGIRIEAMSPVTYPSMSPAPTSTIQALQVLVSNDTNLRFMMDQSGGMNWGSGAAVADVTFTRTAAGVLTVGGAINDTVAWANFTPTITAGSGTFTTVAGSGRFNQIGKRVFFTIRVQITTNGTAAGNVTATLPVNSNVTLPQIVCGRERGVSGKSLVAAVNSANINIFNYDNTYPGANGADIIISGVYEAA